MYEFEPASPTYAISDTIVEHHLHGRDRTRADLPGGYWLTLRTRERHCQLEAALAAPSPTGPARICTARISAHTPTPVTSRILDTVTRSAPALPDARDAHPPLQAVTRLLTTGAPFQQPGEPGLFVQFGHAEAWLEGRRLSVTLGSPGSGLSLVLSGPWDAPSTARLTAAILRELTDAEQLASQVASLLQPGPWQVLSDQWHPDAALILPASRRVDPEDPLGRHASRAPREVKHDLSTAQPDWDFQELISADGSAVALRVTPRDRAVPRLVRKVVGNGAHGPDELGNTRTTFTPADLPPPPDFAPARHPHEVPSLDLQVAPKNEAYAYGVKLELGNWAYALDPRAVFYGPGWYPFHEHVTRREKDPTAPLNDRDVPTGRTVPARVRLSPDVADFSWGNEYVQLTPVDHRVEARLHLYVGQEQARTLVRTVTLEVDLRARRVVLPVQLPADLRHQAEVKGRRILDLLLAARREGAQGASKPRAVLGPWDRGDPTGADASRGHRPREPRPLAVLPHRRSGAATPDRPPTNLPECSHQGGAPVNSTQPTTHPATFYDHSAGPPELQVSGEVGGRTAVFTLRPTFAESVDPGPLLGVNVHVATHFRIPMTFTATFNQVTGARWELVRFLCDQDDYLSSVRTVRPQVAACAAKVLEEQRAQKEPLLAIAREREAAYALAEVYRARTAAADAHRRVDAAEDEFNLFEVCEERAAAVINQLSRRPGALPHMGPPVVRSTSYGRVLILCPVGHLVQSVKAKDWSGSQPAARCADPAFTVTCHGQTGEPLPH